MAGQCLERLDKALGQLGHCRAGEQLGRIAPVHGQAASPVDHCVYID